MMIKEIDNIHEIAKSDIRLAIQLAKGIDYDCVKLIEWLWNNEKVTTRYSSILHISEFELWKGSSIMCYSIDPIHADTGNGVLGTIDYVDISENKAKSYIFNCLLKLLEDE